MDPALVTALATAVVGLVVAGLAWLTAKTQANTRAIELTHAAVIAKAAPRPARATDLVGGAAAGIPGGDRRAVRQAPLWDQLNDPLSTGVLPAQRLNECGEECCAEVIYAQHGVEVSADALRAQIRGAGGPAITSGQDLVKILGRNNVAAVLHNWNAAEARVHVQASVAAARSVIALGRWVSPTILHWVLITSASADGVGYNDPWGGVRTFVTWEDFGARYAGDMVTIVREGDAA